MQGPAGGGLPGGPGQLEPRHHHDRPLLRGRHLRGAADAGLGTAVEYYNAALRHYFLTYKTIPGDSRSQITVDPLYGPELAARVLEASRADYAAHFG